MKTAIFLFCFTAFGISGYSQLDQTYKIKSLISPMKKPGFKLTPANENIPEKFSVTPQRQLQNEMPVLKLSSKGILKNNNGRGEDIYVYEPDNMPCLKPDSTFRSKMPTGGLSLKQR